MPAAIHPGAVLHGWDHFVITLRDDTGRRSAFLSLYAITYSATLGAGQVAFLRVDDPAALPGAFERALHAVTVEKRQALLNVICRGP